MDIVIFYAAINFFIKLDWKWIEVVALFMLSEETFCTIE